MTKDSNGNQSDTEYEDSQTGAPSPNLKTTNTAQPSPNLQTINSAQPNLNPHTTNIAQPSLTPQTSVTNHPSRQATDMTEPRRSERLKAKNQNREEDVVSQPQLQI